MTADQSVTATLARGLSILDAFRVAQTPLRHRDIVARTSLPKATVTRLVRTLCDQGYLDRLDPEHFRLGDNLITLGAMSIDQSPMVASASPVMADLAGRHGVHMRLCVFRDGALSVLQDWGRASDAVDGDLGDDTTRLVDLILAAALGVAPSHAPGQNEILGRARFALGTDGFLTSCMVAGIRTPNAVAAPVRAEGREELTLVVASSTDEQAIENVDAVGRDLVKLARRLRRDPL